MDISVIIVNYKVRDFLHLCVSSVVKALQDIDGEIIVADNHSGDGSCEMLEKHFPQVKRICLQENTGFAKANNLAVQKVQGRYVLILNPDTVIPEDNIRKALEMANRLPGLGALGVRMIDGRGKFLPESKRNVPTPAASLEKFSGGKLARKHPYYATHLKETENGYADILAGAYMLMERKKYLEAGGFDETYFMYGEDVDLSYTLLQKGYRNYYSGSTHILHFKGESTRKDGKYLKRFFGAMKIFYHKHFSPNPLYGLPVKTGIYLMYLWGHFKLRFKSSPEETPIERILYIGSEEKVFNALKKESADAEVHIFAQCATRVISRWDDLEKIIRLIDELKIDTLVFDTGFLTYDKILFYMYEMNDKKLHFRIFHNETGKLIGSDRSDAQGSVTRLI